MWKTLLRGFVKANPHNQHRFKKNLRKNEVPGLILHVLSVFFRECAAAYFVPREDPYNGRPRLPRTVCGRKQLFVLARC